MPNPWVLKAISASHTFLFRLTGGRFGGKIRGVSILLLTTTGRKTGKKRTTPLMYTSDGGNVVLIASKGGAPEHPAWFVNLKSHPTVEVEIMNQKKTMTARTATQEERPRLWSAMAKLYPSYDDYQHKTTREIPIVVLEPTVTASVSV